MKRTYWIVGLFFSFSFILCGNGLGADKNASTPGAVFTRLMREAGVFDTKSTNVPVPPPAKSVIFYKDWPINVVRFPDGQALNLPDLTQWQLIKTEYYIVKPNPSETGKSEVEFRDTSKDLKSGEYAPLIVRTFATSPPFSLSIYYDRQSKDIVAARGLVVFSQFVVQANTSRGPISIPVTVTLYFGAVFQYLATSGSYYTGKNAADPRLADDELFKRIVNIRPDKSMDFQFSLASANPEKSKSVHTAPVPQSSR